MPWECVLGGMGIDTVRSISISALVFNGSAALVDGSETDGSTPSRPLDGHAGPLLPHLTVLSLHEVRSTRGPPTANGGESGGGSGGGGGRGGGGSGGAGASEAEDGIEGSKKRTGSRSSSRNPSRNASRTNSRNTSRNASRNASRNNSLDDAQGDDDLASPSWAVGDADDMDRSNRGGLVTMATKAKPKAGATSTALPASKKGGGTRTARYSGGSGAAAGRRRRKNAVRTM